MKQILLLNIFILFILNSSFGQDFQKHSAHKSQKDFFDSIAQFSPDEFKAYQTPVKLSPDKSSKECTLENIVFGWHPWWSDGLEDNYQWNLLSDLSYFSYEVDYLTGDAETIYDWETANVIDEAQANGVRVNLCITLFANHAAFFASPGSQQNLIDNLLTLVQNRNANGVNIDFESVPSSEAVNFNNFLVDLATQFHTEIPGSQVSIALHAVDWNGIYDITMLKDYLDLFIIMGYDYYWSAGGWEDYAGPTGQLYTMHNFNYNQSRSITSYLYEGVPKEKLVLGVPYYGFDYPTVDNTVPTTVSSSGNPITIKAAKNNTNGYFSNKEIDENSLCAYYNYNNGNPHQTWIDEEETMKFKYDVVQQQGIAGIGIWALGYDDGYPEMWDLIETNFSNCKVVPSTYDLYDMGGPTRDHFNRENYTYTIAPTDYTDYLVLDFSTFELEANYDSLWIYDGVDTNAPLIGGYSGTTSPGTVEASGGALTIKFYSDGATVRQGWNAEWRCAPLDINKQNAYDLKIFPNPTDTYIHISEQVENIQIFTLNGILIQSSQETDQINVSGLSAGIYILKIKSLDKVFLKKIVIQH